MVAAVSFPDTFWCCNLYFEFVTMRATDTETDKEGEY